MCESCGPLREKIEKLIAERNKFKQLLEQLKPLVDNSTALFLIEQYQQERAKSSG